MEPLRSTSSVFDESVLKVEFLPLPAQVPDFAFNLNTEAAYVRFANLMNALVGPMRVQGCGGAFDYNNITVQAGLMMMGPFLVRVAQTLSFSADANTMVYAKCSIFRCTSDSHPDLVNINAPIAPAPLPGPNQYRSSVQFFVESSGALPANTLTDFYYKIFEVNNDSHVSYQLYLRDVKLGAIDFSDLTNDYISKRGTRATEFRVGVNEQNDGSKVLLESHNEGTDHDPHNDLRYAGLAHNHDEAYSPSGHNHDERYVKKDSAEDVSVKKLIPAVQLLDPAGSPLGRLVAETLPDGKARAILQVRQNASWLSVLQAREDDTGAHFWNHDVYAKGYKLATESYVQQRIRSGQFAMSFHGDGVATANSIIRLGDGNLFTTIVPNGCRLISTTYLQTIDDESGAQMSESNETYVFSSLGRLLKCEVHIGPNYSGYVFPVLKVFGGRIVDGQLSWTQIAITGTMQDYSFPVNSDGFYNATLVFSI